MTNKRLILTLQPDVLAICRLDPATPLSSDMLNGNFVAITKTDEELSIICPQTNITDEAIYTRGWRCLRIEGPFAPDTTGILAAVLSPLANANLSVFTATTYDTGHVLVREQDLNQAIQILAQAGHTVRSENKATAPHAIQ
ncbi:ACT domain-containing protein [Dictyobacter aurantiacus]|uniref:Amino acid-binding protein n=1 Tax=Dictyobacter aurantiacus TaxID=1936993 RepID=A0A401ZRT3_9CHLR|nr:ACT domain-containing protein [Dictyobacter aurantiacus]GCE09599.1 amino acid-binding protein [Dictyobacter aurantiacus]